MAKVEIFEEYLTEDENARITILRGGLNTDNPTAIMNEAVSQYVSYEGCNQFVEIPLNNPWVRVIISHINDLEYKPFKNQTINQKIDKNG